VDDRRRNRAARRQAAILAVCVVALAVAAAAFLRQPADENELKIPIAELRSQSAELDVLDRALARGLAGRFAQAHAGQLAQTVDRSRDELTSLKTPERLSEQRADALRLSSPLVTASAALHEGRAPLAASTSAQVVASGAALQAIEERLRR